jgi:hypothetical protein
MMPIAARPATQSNDDLEDQEGSVGSMRQAGPSSQTERRASSRRSPTKKVLASTQSSQGTNGASPQQRRNTYGGRGRGKKRGSSAGLSSSGRR